MRTSSCGPEPLDVTIPSQMTK